MFCCKQHFSVLLTPPPIDKTGSSVPNTWMEMEQIFSLFFFPLCFFPLHTRVQKMHCRPSPPTIPLCSPSSLPSILHSPRQTIKASFSAADPRFTLTSAPSPVADRGVSYSPRIQTWCTTGPDSEPDFGSRGQLAELWLSGYGVTQAEQNA